MDPNAWKDPDEEGSIVRSDASWDEEDGGAWGRDVVRPGFLFFSLRRGWSVARWDRRLAGEGWTLGSSLRMRASGKTWSFLVLMAILILPRFVDTKRMVSIAQEWVATRGSWAPLALVLVHASSLAVCFPFAIAFEVLAGALFGMRKGTALVMAAKTLGASLAFLVARAILRPEGQAGDKSIQGEEMKKSTSAVMISSIARGVERDGWKFVFLARLSPLPSYTLNYGLAATKIHFGAFILATALGQSLFVWQNVSMGYAVVQASKNDAWSMIKRWAIPAISSIIIARKVASYAKDYSEGAVQGKDHRSADYDTERERKDADTPESSKDIVSPGIEGSVRRSARLRRTKR